MLNIFKRKKEIKNINFGIKYHDCDECRKDSISHEIAKYFDESSIQNKMLMRYDNENKVVLISEKKINELLRMITPGQPYEKFKLVNELHIFEKKK